MAKFDFVITSFSVVATEVGDDEEDVKVFFNFLTLLLVFLFINFRKLPSERTRRHPFC